ncbi:MAG: ABC transporter ATP-binding protein [bacterium]|nr:ABC transporter ATP-binding protein [bacterium]
MSRGPKKSASMGEPIFQGQGLTRIYQMGDVTVAALRGVDLELYDGEFVVILGPSGSGKSTLLNILGGLDVATSGEVYYAGGHALHNASESELTRYRREHIGFVFQFYNLIPGLTAAENVRLATEVSSNPLPPEEALDLVGLAARRDHFPAQMSGGEQQRVAIARGIAKRPDVLFCDEPTGALDQATGKLVLAALRQVNLELHTTTVIITHNASIAGMADRVFYMADGAIERVVRNRRKKDPSEINW